MAKAEGKTNAQPKAQHEAPTGRPAAHTPGPWTVDEDDCPWTNGDSHTASDAGEAFGPVEIMFEIKAGDEVIARIPWEPVASDRDQATIHANARLIAAAPRMLEALKALIDARATDADGDCVMCGESETVVDDCAACLDGDRHGHVYHAITCPVAEARAILRDVQGEG